MYSAYLSCLYNNAKVKNYEIIHPLYIFFIIQNLEIMYHTITGWIQFFVCRENVEPSNMRIRTKS